MNVISRISSFAREDVSVQIDSYSEMLEKHMRQEEVCGTQNKIGCALLRPILIRFDTVYKLKDYPSHWIS